MLILTRMSCIAPSRGFRFEHTDEGAELLKEQTAYYLSKHVNEHNARAARIKAELGLDKAPPLFTAEELWDQTELGVYKEEDYDEKNYEEIKREIQAAKTMVKEAFTVSKARKAE